MNGLGVIDFLVHAMSIGIEVTVSSKHTQVVVRTLVAANTQYVVAVLVTALTEPCNEAQRVDCLLVQLVWIIVRVFAVSERTLCEEMSVAQFQLLQFSHLRGVRNDSLVDTVTIDIELDLLWHGQLGLPQAGKCWLLDSS